jgi:hypothetical protein
VREKNLSPGDSESVDVFPSLAFHHYPVFPSIFAFAAAHSSQTACSRCALHIFFDIFFKLLFNLGFCRSHTARFWGNALLPQDPRADIAVMQAETVSGRPCIASTAHTSFSRESIFFGDLQDLGCF